MLNFFLFDGPLRWLLLPPPEREESGESKADIGGGRKEAVDGDVAEAEEAEDAVELEVEETTVVEIEMVC